jgi:hypothetical protein
MNKQLNENDFEDLDSLYRELGRESTKHFWVGLVITLLAFILLGVILFYMAVNIIPTEREQIVSLANCEKETTGVIVFFLVSKLIVGTFLTTIFYLMLKLGFNSFDQSVRTSKRHHGAYFIKFLFKADNQEKISINKKMEFYNLWIKAIESAFTNSTSTNKELSKIIMDKLDKLDINKLLSDLLNKEEESKEEKKDDKNEN